MKKLSLILFSCFCLSVIAFTLAKFPEAEISNGLITARLYLPDAEQGYYQGTRFDWSGVILSLKYKGHNYFEPWFDKHDPKIHDAITGPVEEFTTIGYEQAKPGDHFLKIGVGMLRKPDDSPYHFVKPYKIVNPGKWTTLKQSDRVEFMHELTDEAGYAYIYRKTVRLTKGKPELVLEHRLKNTGRKTIETDVYNHNFFVIDNEPTGPGIVTSLPFHVQAEGKGIGDIAEIRENQLIYTRPVRKGENVYSSGLQGFGTSAKDYDIRIENTKSGAGVRITSDQPLSKLVYWSCATTACPEPYIHLQAAPGQEISWKIAYEFYTNPATD